MRAVVALSGVVLRQTVRDRRALILMLVLPLAVAAFVGMATQQSDELRIGVTKNSGLLGEDLITKLDAQENVDVRTYDSKGELERAVLRGAVLVGVATTAEYDSDLRAGRTVSTPVIVGQGTEAQAALATVDAVVARQSAQIEAALADPTATSFEESFRASGELAAGSRDVEVAIEPVGTEETRTGVSYSAPAMLVLFTFIASLASATSLIEAQRLGITRRVLASPTSVVAIIAGMGLGRLLIAVAQSFIIVIGGVLLGAYWGNLLAGVVLVVAFAIVSTAAGLLVATTTRNSQFASAVGVPIGVALGMLGGCIWSLEVVGPTLTRIGHLTPHAWAMDGWLELGDGGFLGDLLPALLALLVFAVVLIPLATWRLRATIERS